MRSTTRSVGWAPSHAPWTDAALRLIGSRAVSIAVGTDGGIRFAVSGRVPRLPASNQKLLTSMAVLAAFGPRHRLATLAEGVHRIRKGTLHGDLWLVGSGDPKLTGARLAQLAARLWAGGLRSVAGSVVGDTGAFDRGWWAPGWIPGLSRRYVARPTALALDGNLGAGRPELTAAAGLTDALRRQGVRVSGSPRTGRAPATLISLSRVLSPPLASILSRQNTRSVNFDAEMLTKALGDRLEGEGSTDAGGDAIERWARRQGVRVRAEDGSGLSHRDRVSAVGMVKLLMEARSAPWGSAFIASLPVPGEGTLGRRLAGLSVHAKTGTLFVTPVSALSGYVRDADGRLVTFSILSRGMDKPTAVAIEDAVVRVLSQAHVT